MRGECGGVGLTNLGATCYLNSTLQCFKSVPELTTALEKVPALRPRVRAAFLISDRRWDLQLENGISVRLPEENIDAALADLVKMDEDSGLLSRDIVAIDMRLGDRVTVRLTDEATEQRKVMTGGKGYTAKKERDT